MTIETDVDDVLCIAPEFEGEESRIEKFIEFAKVSIDEDVWGDKATLGTAYLTAHMLTRSSRGGIAGDVKRKKLGDSEIEYGVSNSMGTDDPDAEIKSTAYGQEYLRLRKSLVITPVLAGC